MRSDKYLSFEEDGSGIVRERGRRGRGWGWGRGQTGLPCAELCAEVLHSPERESRLISPFQSGDTARPIVLSRRGSLRENHPGEHSTVRENAIPNPKAQAATRQWNSQLLRFCRVLRGALRVFFRFGRLSGLANNKGTATATSKRHHLVTTVHAGHSMCWMAPHFYQKKQQLL